MSSWNPSPGSSPDPGGRPAPGAPGEAGLTGSQYPPPAGAAPSPPPPAPPGGSRRRRPGAKLWISLAGAAAIVVVLVVIIATVIVRPAPGPANGVSSRTPLGVQLQQLLPPSSALPNGWYLTTAPHGSATYGTAGKLPPEPMNQCLDFNQGFDVGAPGDTFVSSASETAQFGAGPGDGFLRADLFAVTPGDADLAIKAVSGWTTRCASYHVKNQYYDIHYTVTAAPVPGLGDKSLDVRVTYHQPSGPGASLLRLPSNNTLLVAVGNDLIAIECLAPKGAMIDSLTALAAPMARKLPSASTLPTSGPALRPKPAPPASPNLSTGQLNNLLPTTSGLPAAYYQNGSNSPLDWPAASDVPLTAQPSAMSCSQMISLTNGAALYQFDINYRQIAMEMAIDANSDYMYVEIDEVTSDALAAADLNALKTAGAACRQASETTAGDTQVYQTTVTSVPGLGEQNVNVYLAPVSNNQGLDFGSSDIIMARFGAAVVMVSYSLSQPGPLPPVAAITRRIVDRL